MSLSVLLWPKAFTGQVVINPDYDGVDYDEGDGAGCGDNGCMDSGEGWGEGIWTDQEGNGFSPGSFRHSGDGNGAGQGDKDARSVWT